MQNPAAKIYCPNYTCQTANPHTAKFCKQCRTPLPKRYLWGVGKGVDNYQPGDILAERYQVMTRRVFLDTKPGQVPQVWVDLPESTVPYLKLFPYRLHVPQIYGVLSENGNPTVQPIWLLEQGAIAVVPQGEATASNNGNPAVRVELLPSLRESWKQASPLRQLYWLWQIAQLWHPFAKEKVVSTLVQPELLRVEGSILKILELKFDRGQTIELDRLGRLGRQLLPHADPLVAPFLDQLFGMLERSQIRTATQLLELLDRAIATTSRLYRRTYQLATGTDRGPTRRRNEDACYPASETEIAIPPDGSVLAIVCDGIGGHEGGNVASQLAIEAVRDNLQPLLERPVPLNPQTLNNTLEGAVRAANQLISERNDGQQRQGRQRMGTTLVMAFARDREIYLTHVGDSRAYWITRSGCRQVTLDDDVASREVRLGYALYRDALQQGASGSLIQALGMGASAILHPTVQRTILDEDSVFLLCSDGLSDNDRVEQYWETEILPILTGELNVRRAVTKLIDIGNYHNGHDNVTVAVLFCRVEPDPDARLSPHLLLEHLESIPTTNTGERDPAEASSREADTQIPKKKGGDTQLVPPPQTKPNSLLSWPVALAAIALLGVGIVAVLMATERWQNPIAQYSPSPVVDSGKIARDRLDLKAFYRLELTTNANDNGNNVRLLLAEPVESASATEAIVGMIPVGSIVQIQQKQQLQGESEIWVKLQVCAIPNAPDPGNDPATSGRSPDLQLEHQSSPIPPSDSAIAHSPANHLTTPSPVKAGQIGWIRETRLLGSVREHRHLHADDIENCTPLPAEGANSPPTDRPPTTTSTP
ncbi:protein phosphatase 2C domain-containing protein [Oxynema sp. CENA135]|uniref:PP2C family serine/threonine-protein phosphatase n=1 Tax=Oxynema sp. CENA135 TaxID=984206 RepID=UPI00190C23F8|nr:protein phosphatase 2C domain-containing protein [Oxynema sp. CENA135]MBK4729379.1 protein phosphatase 2C domain-containing protein [Oxynema sp. CENA135]